LVPRESKFRPITSFVLATVDLFNGMQSRPGTFVRRGHDYRIDLRLGIERAYGRAVGSTQLMAAIESASGVVNAVAIATASPRLMGIALAGFDYVMDMQTERGDGTELFYARCAVLHAARMAKIDAFDVVFPDVNDEDGFLREVELIRKLGFNGKSLINPRQIELLHNAYAPTEEEVEHAERVIAAADKAERAGLGVISLNGKMIDAPVVNRARRVLQTAQASGVRR